MGIYLFSVFDFLQLHERCRCRDVLELFSCVPVMLCIVYQGYFGETEDWLFNHDWKILAGEP